jgi:hypothetical protein
MIKLVWVGKGIRVTCVLYVLYIRQTELLDQSRKQDRGKYTGILVCFTLPQSNYWARVEIGSNPY